MLLLLAGIDEIYSQSTKKNDFFPLKITNSWTCFWYEDPLYLYADTEYYLVRLKNTEIINDTTYFKANHILPFSRINLLRKDSNGNVYARVKEKDFMLFNFQVNIEKSYDIKYFNGYDAGRYKMTFVSSSNKVETHTAIFTNCLRYMLRRIGTTESDYYIWLAPNIGIVELGGFGMAIQYNLKRARINNKLISSGCSQ